MAPWGGGASARRVAPLREGWEEDLVNPVPDSPCHDVSADVCGVPTSRSSDADSVEERVGNAATDKSAQSLTFTARKEILRAIPAGAALKHCGYIFRRQRSPAFHLSQNVESIDEFWSHNWSAPAKDKIALLLFHCNGLASAVAGLVAAALSQLVPLGDERAGVERLGAGAELEYSSLSALAAVFCGTTAATVVLFFWSSWHKVFLDKACIDQENMDLKMEGIRSLGGFLRKSRTMLIAWDAGYFTRLWCVFELAARLKLVKDKGREGASIKLRPSVQGKIVVVMLWACSWLVVGREVATLLELSKLETTLANLVLQLSTLLILFVFVRDHVSAMDALHEQIATFTMDKAKCHCCSVGHVDPTTGQPMACDRELISASVAEWFGDVNEFHRYLKEHAWRIMAVRSCMPYHYLLYAGLPFWFRSLALIAASVRGGELALLPRLLASELLRVLVKHVAIYLFIFTVFSTVLRGPGKGTCACICKLCVCCIVVMLGLGVFFSLLEPLAWRFEPWGVCVFYFALASCIFTYYFRW